LILNLVPPAVDPRLTETPVTDGAGPGGITTADGDVAPGPELPWQPMEPSAAAIPAQDMRKAGMTLGTSCS